MQKQAIPILMYHSICADVHPLFKRYAIAPEQFRKQMAYLKSQDLHPMRVTELVTALRSQTGLPEKPLLLTFDDGFEDFYTQALPIIESSGFTATLFMPTQYVGKTSQWLKSAGEENRPILNWGQLKEITQRGVECGGHSHSHAELDRLPHKQTLAEITQCKDILEARLGQEISSFAYPFGYYNRAVKQMVKAAGYLGACAVRHTTGDGSEDLFALRRVIVTSDLDIKQFAKLVSHHSTKKELLIREVREFAANFLRRNNLFPRVEQ